MESETFRGRKRRKVRGSIRVKMTLGLVPLFFVSAFLMSIVLTDQNAISFKRDISRDMAQIWQNANTYTMQLMIAKHCNNDEEGFKQVYDNLVKSLKTERIGKVYAFDIADGSYHNLTEGGESQKIFHNRSIFNLLVEAKNGHANFMLYKGDDDICDVKFVFPVSVADKIVGILAVDQDYTEANRENNNSISSTIELMLLVFAAVFFVIWILLGRWLKPVVKLSLYAESLTGAIENHPDSELPKIENSLLKRRDEIGILARNYENVTDTVFEQFNKIMELVEDKQSFFNNVTHELKTPLTTIMGYSQLISEDKNGDKELLETGMRHINSESDRLYNMVIKLLEFAKVQNERELEKIVISDIMMDVVSAMQPKAKNTGKDFVIESISKTAILGNEDEITELFMNLIDNAIKYGKKDTPICVGIRDEEDRLSCTVKNYGTPIPEEALPKLFEPFFRVDKEHSRAQGSAGLGLSICKKIMEHHNGDIEVSNKADGEICFTLTFYREGQTV